MGEMTPALAPGLFTVEDYHSFLESRPDDERYRGTPLAMVSPPKS